MVLGVSVNLWAVLVATIAGHVIGFLWYGPLFGKTWLKLMNFGKEGTKKMKLSGMQAMSMGLIGALITNYVLAVVLGLTGASSVSEGIMTGFWVWLGFAMPLHLGVVLWEGKPFKLFLFNTLQYLISIMVAASIIAVW